MLQNGSIARAWAILAVLALAVAGCSDRPNDPVAVVGDNRAPVDIPQAITEQLDLYKTVAAEPDHGISHWSKEGGPHHAVELPAGSVNGLAAALAKAGKNGTVVVKAGLHDESDMVIVGKSVRILGEHGAILRFGVAVDPTGLQLNPALHVFNARHVTIWGLEFRPLTAPGGTAILLENADDAVVGNNSFFDMYVGVFIERSDNVNVWRNTIVLDPATPGPLGITNCNGHNNIIASNDVSNGLFGIWACDVKGFVLNNSVHDNTVGIILCKVPENGAGLPGGRLTGSDSPGTRWTIFKNTATNNGWGYLGIDGAYKNTVVNNAASGSSVYDVEFTADTYRFGFLTPAAHDNRFIAGSHPDIVVKDCGNNNTILGGQLVNNSIDPCY